MCFARDDASVADKYGIACSGSATECAPILRVHRGDSSVSPSIERQYIRSATAILN